MLVVVDSICVASELIIVAENLKEPVFKTNLKRENYWLETFLTILKYVGLVILAIYLIEIFIKITFNTHAFLRTKLEIFDSIIIIVSFVLDLVFFERDASTALQLITLLRLWRVARIVNGLV